MSFNIKSLIAQISEDDGMDGNIFTDGEVIHLHTKIASSMVGAAWYVTEIDELEEMLTTDAGISRLMMIRERLALLGYEEITKIATNPASVKSPLAANIDGGAQKNFKSNYQALIKILRDNPERYLGKISLFCLYNGFDFRNICAGHPASNNVLQMHGLITTKESDHRPIWEKLEELTAEK
jgi:hypothetical protein